MSNRVEELESQVTQLQSIVDGITEELAETRERLQALESSEGVDNSRTPERRDAEVTADVGAEVERAEETAGEAAEEAEAEAADNDTTEETQSEDDEGDSDGNDIIVA
ncbi:MAG: hypothetical protein ABEJ82_02895 [Haloplanus sp.]